MGVSSQWADELSAFELELGTKPTACMQAIDSSKELVTGGATIE